MRRLKSFLRGVILVIMDHHSMLIRAKWITNSGKLAADARIISRYPQMDWAAEAHNFCFLNLWSTEHCAEKLCMLTWYPEVLFCMHWGHLLVHRHFTAFDFYHYVFTFPVCSALVWVMGFEYIFFEKKIFHLHSFTFMGYVLFGLFFLLSLQVHFNITV